MNFYLNVPSGIVGAISFLLIFFYYRIVDHILGENYATNKEIVIELICFMTLGAVIDFSTSSEPEFRNLFVLSVAIIYVPLFFVIIWEVMIAIYTFLRKAIDVFRDNIHRN